MNGVSIVIPHHGSAVSTVELIRLLQRQTTQRAVQIIVSDDASPSRFPHVPGVQVVHRTRNGGFGSAVNSGAALAQHEYLLILNSDVIMQDTFIEELLVAAEPWMPAVASPHVTTLDGHDAWTGRHFPRTRHQFVEWLAPLARWREWPTLHEAVGHDTRAAEGDTVVDWVVGAAMLVPTSEFRAVGGFDERYFMNSEEVDLQRRLKERGVPSVVLGSPTLIHEGGGSSDAARRRSWLVTSRLAYAGKWGGRRRLQVALSVATAVNLGWNIGRRCLGRPVSPWQTAHAELELIWPKVPGCV
jgi:N-acetylglucosaminyl-diphospho-decaprenol L-rhamnosyltransferase